jgi:hypothetical protein
VPREPGHLALTRRPLSDGYFVLYLAFGSGLSPPVERRCPHLLSEKQDWGGGSSRERTIAGPQAHTQDEECRLRHQDSPQSSAAAAAAPSNARGVGGTRNSFCNFHIGIGDEKTSAANLITRAADSSIGGRFYSRLTN